MTKSIIIIIAVVFSLNASAQVRASVSASVSIVDVAGASFSNQDNLSPILYANNFKKMEADETVALGTLVFIDESAYCITLPSAPITLSRMSGKDLLTIQSLQVIPSNKNTSMVLMATCLPERAQVPGSYASATPVEIVIDYN